MGFPSIFTPTIYSEHYWPQICFMYSKTWNAYNMDFHSHEHTEVMYLLIGHCSVFIRNDSHQAERELELRNGDFIVLDCNVTHRIAVPESCYMLNVEFYFAPTQSSMYTLRNLLHSSTAFHRLIAQHHSIMLGRDSSGELYRTFVDMLDGFSRASARSSMQCVFEAKMAVFLLQLSEQYFNSKLAPAAPAYIRKAARFIESSFFRQLSVADVAAHVGLNSVYLQRIFHQTMGITVLQYITRLRIDKVKTLLENCADITLDEIAHQVGYMKRQSLILAFKKLEGTTPGEYKRLYARSDRQQYTILIDSKTPQKPPH